MKTVLVTGNFDGEIQTFFSEGGRRGHVGKETERETESFSTASREKRSVFIIFIIQMTHMELFEPLVSQGYTFQRERFSKSQPKTLLLT